MKPIKSPVSPFIKWAGGKRWLTSSHPDLLPSTYNVYYEPFLGGAAVFLHLSPESAVLGDQNKDLISTYRAIQKNWKSVYQTLQMHDSRHSRDYYYQVRDSSPSGYIQRAARFIYLNRTCWNGLHRVSAKGRFNVPIGSARSALYQHDNFETLSELLKTAEFVVGDFEETLSTVSRGDFVYIDPPYTVHHATNGFLEYNEKIFTWEDQCRLRDVVVALAKRRAKVLVSQADHASIRKLYSGIGTLESLSRNSLIAADGSRRSRFNEVVIRVNY